MVLQVQMLGRAMPDCELRRFPIRITLTDGCHRPHRRTDHVALLAATRGVARFTRESPANHRSRSLPATAFPFFLTVHGQLSEPVSELHLRKPEH